MKKVLYHFIFAYYIFIMPLNAIEEETKNHQILYLMQSSRFQQALNLYETFYLENGRHDFELLQTLALILLDQGFKSRDPETQLLSLFGAGLSANEKALYLLEEGLLSPIPQIQVVALGFLARSQDDRIPLLLAKCMGSPFLLLRLETLFQLAQRGDPKAYSQTESLMNKVDPALLPLFAELYGIMSSYSKESARMLRRLLMDQRELVRLAAILSCAKHHREELLPQLRRLAIHKESSQQEACAIALGSFRDESAIPQLEKLVHSSVTNVQIAAAYSLYLLGCKEHRILLEQFAKEGNLFAIAALKKVPESSPILMQLLQHGDLNVRVNAAVSLLSHRKPLCLPTLINVFVVDRRDLLFTLAYSPGKSLSYWKVIPSAEQNCKEDPLIYELSLKMREELLCEIRDLPEKHFLEFASLLFESRQNDLIPTLVQQLENLRTPAAIALLKKYREQVGAPLIRNYCNLALYRLKQAGPYCDQLKEWMRSRKEEEMIRFRTFVPWEKRGKETLFQLTPQESSRLMLEALEAFTIAKEEEGVTLLLDLMRSDNKNRYALAGLLLQMTV